MLSFQLDKEFINHYKAVPEPFGYDGLGAVTFYRTYSRTKADGTQETWAEVCERVINGMYSIQKDYTKQHGREWSDTKAQRSAQEAYDRMFNLKWTPAGRGIWLMGTPFIHKRKVSEALQNCAFISTEDIEEQGGEIFSWFMEMLMLGVGVGSDMRGAGKVRVNKPLVSDTYVGHTYVIEDTREAWADSVKILINAYISDYDEERMPLFDYSKIRAKGEPILGFGGVSSGPEPLIKLHERIRKYLDKNSGERITSRTLADIFNAIGACVIAGNVRRSAEILFSDLSDDEFLNLKNYDANPDRAEIGWASNNSLFAFVGSNYENISERIMENGEPGFIWLDNIQQYGRMGEYRPDNAIGSNPCAEQPLANKEQCNLVEVYMNKHESLYDYLRTLKFAYLYGKTVTLTYDWISDKDSREIMTKNRRIGISNTGIAQFLNDNGLNNLIAWFDSGYKSVQNYDERYSAWLGITKSIRLTTVKPSGSVSLLAGSTPGIHHPISEYYIRRIRLQDNTPLLAFLKDCGFHTEKDVYSDNTMVVEFPVHVADGIRKENDLSIWEQLELTAVTQQYWSDNAVSVTIKIDPNKHSSHELSQAISYYQYRLKTVSMLPQTDSGAYAQMPYEEISKERYLLERQKINFDMLDRLKGIMSRTELTDQEFEMYCSNDTCEIVYPQS